MNTQTLLAFVLAAALGGCGSETAPAAPTPAATDGFQKLIYDEQGFSVLRDRETGCQWIARLAGTMAVQDVVPRTVLSASGRVEQLCTSGTDPLSMPMKVLGEHGMFQEIGSTDLTRDLQVKLYRDVETGCEWMLINAYTNGITSTMRPRMGRREDRVEQVCRPVTRP